jgi:hypothetical protein
MSLFTPSGGFVYHLRAARHRARLWATFRAQVADWIEAKLPLGKELVLVGPSAGHCLPLAHLARFQRLTVLEPDAVARWLLRRGLGRSDVELESRDLLLEPLLTGTAGLPELLASRPRAAVLFCNVLGQLHFGLSDDEHARFQEQFRRRIVPLLAGRPWASFHDRWSLDAGVTEPRPPLVFPALPSPQDLGRAWFGSVGPPLAVLDHGTAELFPSELPRRYFGWQISADAFHLVEGVPA